jgi:hypothetical protein
VRRIINLGTGYWRGEGMGKGCGWGGQFTSNLRPRWTRSCHSKEGFQVSKGDQKREQGESWKQGDAPYIS